MHPGDGQNISVYSKICVSYVRVVFHFSVENMGVRV
jgi:hypothetical protein